MSDFWDMFSEHEERRRQRSALSTDPLALGSLQQESYDPLRAAQERRGERERRPEAPDFQRSFMDRVFAPFEAPQQTLFSLTKDVHEEGWSGDAVWNALSHGANYFNPFSNTERIYPNEMRTIFLGSSDSEKQTWTETGTDVFISMFYDPLWLLPPLAAARRAGHIGARTHEIAKRMVNPGQLIGDVAKQTTVRGVRPALRSGARALGKEDEYIKGTTNLSQWVFDRFAGVPAAVREKMSVAEREVIQHQQTAAIIARETGKLNKGARTILADALQTQAVRDRQILNLPLAGQKADDFTQIVNRLDRAGVDKDLFWHVYQQINEANTKLGDTLFKAGLIPQSEMAELGGIQLRRMYTGLDNGGEVLERINQLMANPAIPKKYKGKTVLMFDRSKLRDEMTKASAHIDDFFGKAGIQFSKDTRYFTRGAGGRGRFNADNFADDLSEFLRHNPEASLMEVMEHTNNTMLGGGRLPGEMNEILMNFISHGRVRAKGLRGWKETFEQGQSGLPSVQAKHWRQNLEVIAHRESIPEIIRREVLGEIQDAGPRAIEGIMHGSKQLVVASLFDELAGAVRMSPEMHRLALRVGTLGKQADPEDLRKLQQLVVKATGLGEDSRDVQKLLNRMTGKAENPLRETHVIHKNHSEWASAQRTAEHSVQLPSSHHLGALSEQYVSPGVALHLQQYDRIADLALHSDKARGMQEFISDMMQRTTGQFKFMKIVSDAGANFRDTVGTLMQMDITTGAPFRVDKLRKAWTVGRDWGAGTNNMYLDAAQSVGYRLMDAGFTGNELKKTLQFRDMFRRQSWDTKNWNESGTNLFQVLGDALGQGKKTVAHWYQTRENFFRSYVFSSTYDDLASKWVRAGKEITPEIKQNFARQAAAKTDMALYNYADIPYAVEWARRYGAAPFITFPTKSTQQMVSVLMERPHRILKYDRGINAWNSHQAGGTEQFLQEVAALPDHKRDALVLRLPGEDVDGNPMYLDLSYFLPWYAIKDLAQDTALGLQTIFGRDSSALDDDTARQRLSGDMGMRSSIISPILFQVYDAIRHGRDGLGRELWKETDTFDTRMAGIGKWLYQFMAPPTAPGGTTADSVGRALQAVARSSPEPMDWAEFLAPVLRDPLRAFPDPADQLDRYGRRPTSRALVGQEGTLDWMGMEPSAHRDAALGAVGSTFLNVTTSDPVRQSQRESTQLSLSNTEIQREMARVKANRNLTPEQKVVEMQRLQQMLLDNKRTTIDRIKRMF